MYIYLFLYFIYTWNPWLVGGDGVGVGVRFFQSLVHGRLAIPQTSNREWGVVRALVLIPVLGPKCDTRTLFCVLWGPCFDSGLGSQIWPRDLVVYSLGTLF